MSAEAVIKLGHGGGGRLQRDLIERIIRPRLANPWLDPLDDAARLTFGSVRLAFTSDAFVVEPLFFPGGDVGALAVNGTVNDLAVVGAIPRHLTLMLILEEGLPLATLTRVLDSIAASARRAEVFVVAGDTKVVERGRAGGGMIVATAGVGELAPNAPLGPSACRPGDELVVSGTLGDHGAAVLAVRSGFTATSSLASDCAPVTGLCQLACSAVQPRFLRDPTRGGLLAIAHELAAAAAVTVEFDERALPFRSETLALSEVLGIDAWRLPSEGRVVAAAPCGAGAALAAAWGRRADGVGAAVIGRIRERLQSIPVILNTRIGGRRVLDLPADEPLPRIC